MSKILLTSFGSRGDIQPMFVLAQALQQRGHQVLCCASSNFADWAADLNLPFHGFGRDFEAWLKQCSHLITTLKPRELPQMAATLREEILAHFKGLHQVAPGYDRMLVFGAQMAGPSVAEYYNIPCCYITFCPMIYHSRHHAPMSFIQYGLPNWMNPLLWRLNNMLFNWLALPALNPFRKELGLVPIKDIWAHSTQSQTILTASPVLAPLPPDNLHHPQTSFLRFQSGGEIEADLLTFVQSGSPPVYIGLGSMVDGDPAQLTQLFIQAIQQAGVRALIATGWAGLTAENVPENIRVIGATPHDVLFPMLGGIVHHGGAGTTFSAALAGVPQMTLPILLDQYYWGKRLGEMELGPPMIPRLRLTADNLAQALIQLVTNANYRANAQRVAGQLQQEDGAALTVAKLGL